MEEIKIEKLPEAKVLLVTATPIITPEQFDLLTEGQDAIVFLVFATGTSPERLNNIIKKRTQEGTPIFLVSNNPGDNHGIIKITYDVQVESSKAGAIPLEKVNVNNLEEIISEIKKQFLTGKKGIELAHAVQNVFSYKEGEEKPVPGWENPNEVKKQKDLTRSTLRRLGLSEIDIEKELIKMGF
ncbi:MAG: hypothetical protein WCS86_00845 [Candidatus Paceibacterota bacterium]